MTFRMPPVVARDLALGAFVALSLTGDAWASGTNLSL